MQLISLTKLNVSHNMICVLDDGISLLTGLAELDVHHTKLANISKSISMLSSLVRLDCACTMLSDVLPLTALDRLQKLNLSHCAQVTMRRSRPFYTQCMRQHERALLA